MDMIEERETHYTRRILRASNKTLVCHVEFLHGEAVNN
jgi:hypothetical protein